jgi:hypothetical protein
MLALLLTGCTQFKRSMDNFRGKTPGRYARMMEDQGSPDNRRVGIAYLAEQDFAHSSFYTDRYRQIFLTDEDPLVRAMALRALTASRDATASDLYIKALADAEPLIRLEGAKALVRMPNPEATDALLKVLNGSEEDMDLRIAAAGALKHYPRADVARALVIVLDERAFGIAWQARRSLQRITGVDHGYDNAAWGEYLNNPTKPLGA